MTPGAFPDPWHPAVCDVCRLVDGDYREKLCFYCGSCDSEICVADKDRWGRRALAAFWRQFEGERGVSVRSGHY